MKSTIEVLHKVRRVSIQGRKARVEESHMHQSKPIILRNTDTTKTVTSQMRKIARKNSLRKKDIGTKMMTQKLKTQELHTNR